MEASTIGTHKGQVGEPFVLLLDGEGSLALRHLIVC